MAIAQIMVLAPLPAAAVNAHQAIACHDPRLMDMAPGSRLAGLHGGARRAVEPTTCSYGLAPEVQQSLPNGSATSG